MVINTETHFYYSCNSVWTHVFFKILSSHILSILHERETHQATSSSSSSSAPKVVAEKLIDQSQPICKTAIDLAVHSFAQQELPKYRVTPRGHLYTMFNNATEYYRGHLATPCPDDLVAYYHPYIITGNDTSYCLRCVKHSTGKEPCVRSASTNSIT